MYFSNTCTLLYFTLLYILPTFERIKLTRVFSDRFHILLLLNILSLIELDVHFQINFTFPTQCIVSNILT